MLRVLARLTCRIAVIGQVKAGKSTFINGLVRIPGLLPTDVNPWTTAVTHLHFARADAPPNVAAEFTFFDSNEWERLARGGGHIRELTAAPGARLRAGAAAKARGRDAAPLGGPPRRHAAHAARQEARVPLRSPPRCSSRYVCSGLPSTRARSTRASTPTSSSRRTSTSPATISAFPPPSSTRRAPTIPFLVRDEITRRALESADIYVVVLTARQALSSADVALLRILRGLHKERIAVFVNRIDELGDLVRDVPADRGARAGRPAAASSRLRRSRWWRAARSGRRSPSGARRRRSIAR